MAANSVHAAVASLAAQHLIAASGTTLKAGADRSAPADPLELAIVSFIRSGSGTFSRYSAHAQPALNAIKDHLESLGLVLSPWRAMMTQVLSISIAFLAPIFGMMKVGVGLWRNRPVDYLVLELLLSIVAAVCLYHRPPTANTLGKRVLRKLRSDFPKHQVAIAALDPEKVASVVALFGLSAIAHSPIGWLKPFLTPPKSGGSGGCGSGGCGGGGGGGGGGCGGCGGGH